MLVVDSMNCPGNNGRKLTHTIRVQRQSEIRQLTQSVKKMLGLPERAIVSVYRAGSAGLKVDDRASVSELGMKHLDKLTLQAPLLCGGMNNAINGSDSDDNYQNANNPATKNPQNNTGNSTSSRKSINTGGGNTFQGH